MKTSLEKIAVVAGIASEIASRRSNPLKSSEPTTTDLIAAIQSRRVNYTNEKVPSYQTAPLVAYSWGHRQLAEAIFNAAAARLRPGQAHPYKGSYSFFGPHDNTTLAKIVIFERDRGKVNGDWPIDRDGVYVLFRIHGATDASTIGVKPAHAERFTYQRVEPGDVASPVDRIIAAVNAQPTI